MGVLIYRQAIHRNNQAKETEGQENNKISRFCITRSLSSMLAFVETYPELKASANFLELHKNLLRYKQTSRESGSAITI